MNAPSPNAHLPIGVFDSGVGGLTVLRTLSETLPTESFLYLGDTARLPYGTKSPETIRRYAQQTANILIEHNIKMLVIACNTASAHALDHLKKIFPDLPIIGVIEPGAAAAVAASQSNKIAVIATEGTVSAGIYDRAIHRLSPSAQIVSTPTPLFVALAEEGLLEGPIVEQIARYYLEPLFSVPQEERCDCLVLGCTHFPALRATIQKVVGDNVALVDSASTTAQAVKKRLLEHSLSAPNSQLRTLHYLVTDAPERFARTAAIFLPWSLSLNDVKLVDLS